MPRKVILANTDLNGFGAIGAQFDQVVQDEDLLLVQTNVRRMIMPNQDIDEQCDDLDSYFQSIGYPAIPPEARQTLKDIRAAAEANPNMVQARDKWLAEQAAQQAELEANNPQPEPEVTPEVTN